MSAPGVRRGGRRDGRQTVVHPLASVVGPGARVLVLGTMPSPASRQAGFYYSHPRNRFWPVMARLAGVPDPLSVRGRADLALGMGVALWDVLQSCTIRGASDASISDAVPNDVAALLERWGIGRVFTTGATATRLYTELCEPATGVPARRLPSTSPANAAWDLERLAEAYSVLLEPAEAGD